MSVDPRILIVDDEANLRGALEDFMTGEGFLVDTATTGPEGLKAATENAYDLIVLDVMLPDINGFDVCKMLRSENINTPIIMLTAKSEEIDKVLGLEMGADDYLTKPFSSRELLARIRAILRRAPRSGSGNATSDSDTSTAFIFGPNTLDTIRRELTHGDTLKPLTRKEYDLLVYFLEHPNQVHPRETLLESVWGYENSPTTRTVDTHVLSLRQKIEPNPSEPQFIVTVHAQGYRFVKE